MQGCWAERVVRVSIPIKKDLEVGAETVMRKISEFLGQFISETDIDPDVNLFDSGLVNSLFAMQLLLYVEQEFDLQITNEDLDIKNFRSLNALTDFVMVKLDTRA
jgi:acyl carrier protein